MVKTTDQRELGELSPIPSGFVGRFDAEVTPAAVSELVMEGLEAEDVAYARILMEVPYGSVQPQSRGLTVERSFRRVTPGGSEALDLSKPLRKGDVVVSEVRVRRSPVQDVRSLPSQFLVIEDGVPSLAQTIDDDETMLADAGIQPKEDTYWASIKETQRSPHKTVRIGKLLGRDEIKVYQVWRVTFNGKAAIPPAHAFDMYDESLQGCTESCQVRVQ